MRLDIPNHEAHEEIEGKYYFRAQVQVGATFMNFVSFMVKSCTSLLAMKRMKNREIQSKAISRPFAKQRTALPLTQGTKTAKKSVSISE